MRLLLITLFLAPACTGFLARVRDHFEKKFKKPECHLEWEDVTTPHCETSHEQVCEEEYKNQCKTEYNTSCQTEYITQCETEYEELCETTERQRCHTEQEQQCHDEYSEECKTEYSEQCWEEPREACHTEPTQECSTEYSEVCGTEFEEACHTEYTEQCKDVPECWEEQKEECHTVQVKVHHEQPQYQKWKRSSQEGMEDEEADVYEGDLETTGGEKKKRSIALKLGALGASAIAGAVTGAHFGQKLGLAGGLGVGLGSKAIFLKNKRSADGGEFALSEGVEAIERRDLAVEGKVRKEADVYEGDLETNGGEKKKRSIALKLGALGASAIAGAVTGAHFGQKLGLVGGLGVGLGSKA